MKRSCRMWRCCCAALVCGLVLSLGVAVSADETGTPALHITVDADPTHEAFGSVFVTGLDPKALARLQENGPTTQDWQKIFSVRLRALASQTDQDDLPNMAGRYEALATGLRFVPRFSPSPGTLYRIAVQIDGNTKASGDFPIGAAPETGHVATEVEAVYPSSGQIPENALRLYVHFSRAMARGQAADKIRLVDQNNAVVENAFITGPVGELWDPDQRRLTLLFDPGRIKRGVAPNRLLGPALKTDNRVTLVIDQDFKDANGQPLSTEFRKTYKITAAIRHAIAPDRWAIVPPQVGTHNPFRICFSDAMDRALMAHSIRVFNAQGSEVAGQINVSAGETEWNFTPANPWSDTLYVIQVATILEDISGNTLLAPMDAAISSSHDPTPRGTVVTYKEMEIATLHHDFATNRCPSTQTTEKSPQD